MERTSMGADQANRLAGLDLLRGLAALAVLLLHSPWPAGIRPLLPRGYLAVDLFFVLSGFVLARTYDQRLGTPELFKQFAMARLIRIYPLYALATLLSAGLVLSIALFGRSSQAPVSMDALVASIVTALLFLPTPSAWSVNALAFFPLLFVAWSLFWELAVNLLYGLVSIRLGLRLFALLLTVGLAGTMLALSAYGSAEDVGVTWEAAWGGAARALFSFFAGVAIWRLKPRFPAPSVPALGLAAVFLLCLVPQTLGGWPYEVLCIALLFPLLVWLGADASMSPRVRKAGLFLGYLSYPVYLLQVPVLIALAPLFVRLERGLPLSDWVDVMLRVALVLAVSWVLARWFDSPLRAWLRGRFVPRAPRPIAETAP